MKYTELLVGLVIGALLGSVFTMYMVSFPDSDVQSQFEQCAQGWQASINTGNRLESQVQQSISLVQQCLAQHQ
jgi:hypothetical protein